MAGAPRVRAYRSEDANATAEVWHRAGRAAYGFLPTWQAFALEEAREVFRDAIAARCEVFVAELEGRVVAYLALEGSYLDRLYVDPAYQQRGIGARLLEHAKALRPDGLELHTHVENRGARSFYERHGFRAVRFGTSPPPESAPDVEYHWRPRP